MFDARWGDLPCFALALNGPGGEIKPPPLSPFLTPEIERTKLFLSLLSMNPTPTAMEIPKKFQVIVRATALAKAGKPKAGFDLLKDFHLPEYSVYSGKGRSIYHIFAATQVCLMAGEIETALEFAKKMGPLGQAKAFAEIAATLARSGENEKALNLFEQALSSAKAARSAGKDKAEILGFIIRKLIRAGELDKAAEAAEEIPLLNFKSSMLFEIAEAFVRNGRSDRAHEIFEKVFSVIEERKNYNQKNILLAEYAETLVRLKKFDKALEVADKIKGYSGPEDRARAAIASAIASALARNNELEQALEVTKKIDLSPYSKNDPLWAIALALASRNEFEKALQIADQIGVPFYPKQKIKLKMALARADKEKVVEIIKEMLPFVKEHLLLNSEINAAIEICVEALRRIDPDIASPARIRSAKEYDLQLKELTSRQKHAEEAERKNEEVRLAQEAEERKNEEIKQAQEAEERKNEEIKQAQEAEERRNNVIAGLRSRDPAIRLDAFEQYCDMWMEDKRARAPLARMLRNGEGDIRRVASGLAMLDPKLANRTLAEFLRTNPTVLEENELDLERLAKDHGLGSVSALIKELKEARETLRMLNEKIKEIAETVKDKIGERLGLVTDVSAAVSAGNGSYASISFGGGLRLELRQQLALKQELLPANSLTIEESGSLADALARVRSLNFLVHHEIGHIIQKEKRIKPPAFALPELRSFSARKAKRQAKEVLIDKLAFDAARKIYVHNDGDIMLSQGQRESVAINAYLDLAKIVLRNLDSHIHSLPNECLARIAAVLCEFSESTEIAVKTQKEIASLAKTFRSRIINTLASSQGEEAVFAETDKLIDYYRRIFKAVRLEA